MLNTMTLQFFQFSKFSNNLGITGRNPAYQDQGFGDFKSWAITDARVRRALTISMSGPMI